MSIISVEVDESALNEMLSGIQKTERGSRRIFTPTEDAFILAVWYRGLDRHASAKRLGVSEGTMRSRYLVLKEAKDAGNR